MGREEIIQAALRIHDEKGCACDRKYVMSCYRMAAAILALGKMRREMEVQSGYQVRAREIVRDYFNRKREKTDTFAMTIENVYVVWFCKTLQNWKALLSTDVPDQMYYELTHDGDAGCTYVDAYKKFDNVLVRDDDTNRESDPMTRMGAGGPC